MQIIDNDPQLVKSLFIFILLANEHLLKVPGASALSLNMAFKSFEKGNNLFESIPGEFLGGVFNLAQLVDPEYFISLLGRGLALRFRLVQVVIQKGLVDRTDILVDGPPIAAHVGHV